MTLLAFLPWHYCNVTPGKEPMDYNPVCSVTLPIETLLPPFLDFTQGLTLVLIWQVKTRKEFWLDLSSSPSSQNISVWPWFSVLYLLLNLTRLRWTRGARANETRSLGKTKSPKNKRIHSSTDVPHCWQLQYNCPLCFLYSRPQHRTHGKVIRNSCTSNAEKVAHAGQWSFQSRADPHFFWQISSFFLFFRWVWRPNKSLRTLECCSDCNTHYNIMCYSVSQKPNKSLRTLEIFPDRCPPTYNLLDDTTFLPALWPLVRLNIHTYTNTHTHMGTCETLRFFVPFYLVLNFNRVRGGARETRAQTPGERSHIFSWSYAVLACSLANCVRVCFSKEILGRNPVVLRFCTIYCSLILGQNPIFFGASAPHTSPCTCICTTHLSPWPYALLPCPLATSVRVESWRFWVETHCFENLHHTSFSPSSRSCLLFGHFHLRFPSVQVESAVIFWVDTHFFGYLHQTFLVYFGQKPGFPGHLDRTSLFEFTPCLPALWPLLCG